MRSIGEDACEKLKYTPGVFSGERRGRGKWVCVKCQTIGQAPVPTHVIDKGIPTTGLLAHVLVAKYLDHQSLHRQEGIFGRAGVAIRQSTVSQWSLRGGIRAAAAMSLIQSAKLNRHDPYAYLKDVLERLPAQPASRIEELLPHRWTAPLAA